ncbi:MAG: peptidase M17 [Bacteroidales bacterium]|nr:peptidase M17 [Bacteroidales bacterium]
MMKIDKKIINGADCCGDLVVLMAADAVTAVAWLSEAEADYVRTTAADEKLQRFVFDRLPRHCYVVRCAADSACNKLRKAGSDLQACLVEAKVKEVSLVAFGLAEEQRFAFVEGMALNNYSFDRYKSKKDGLLEHMVLDADSLGFIDTERCIKLWQRIYDCREWVNEPVMALNAERFADILSQKAQEAGVSATVLGQKQIASLKMGGLLAVNKGSVDEARFVVLDYNPSNARNAKPIALVGKGIMYDTGGLNIKPDDYMQEMKSDMAGAATMASVVLAAADMALPLHLMAFLPLTDSRPGFNAYAADDILTMFDGTTVEVINTDAEGRIILADAIAYANQYAPELIVDAATLTGAAVRAIGTYGIAAMQQDARQPFEELKAAGEETYERLVEFPFWEEYDELIKSEVADVKNCGTAQAGCITAGKFLARFAKHPYVHLDIAGVAYFSKRVPVYGVGASGYGIRMLMRYLEQRADR